MIFFIENMSILKSIKSYFKSHTIKRILHSFHMKLLKLAKGSFNKLEGLLLACGDAEFYDLVCSNFYICIFVLLVLSLFHHFEELCFIIITIFSSSILIF